MAIRSDIREDMIIYSADGEKLGKVVRCDADSFIIEKGIFFHKDYLVRYEDVTNVRGDEATLSLQKEQLQRIDEDDWARTAAPAEGAMAAEKMPPERMAGETDEIRVPLKEEELVVGKEERQAGRVRVKKEVVTEEKQVTVPVTREEVTVERVPAAQARPTDERFIKEDITVPVHEEEVVVGKRPVVKEEVRVRKTPIQEQRVASETVRREQADVQEEGEIRRAPSTEDKKYET